jgi:hypothetical protein
LLFSLFLVAKIKTAKNNKILFFVARKTMENKNMSYFRPKNVLLLPDGFFGGNRQK